MKRRWPEVPYLGQWFGAGVQFASMDVKFRPLVPESPRVQQVAVVFDPALDPRVFQHIARGTLWEDFFLLALFVKTIYKQHGKTNKSVCSGANSLIRAVS